MSCDAETAISIQGVGKYFEIYDKPSHRLWQMLYRGRRQFYRPFWALRDISFSVDKGECVGIIGCNGAGKSTLLQIVAGTLTPSAGTILSQGRVAALLELGSGFNPDFTGKENVYLNASLFGLKKHEIDAKYDSIAAFADIGEFIDQPVRSYSSGMVVRLAFAVIAHVDADVLIVDEALAVGDAFFTQKCMRFLRNFIKTHTVLFVSHDIAAVNGLCTRAILLEHGMIKAIGSPKEVTEVYLEDLFASIQGESALPTPDDEAGAAPSPTGLEETEYRDMRRDFINASPLRNDIQIFPFNEQSASFGKGGAIIDRVVLTDAHGAPLSWMVGGEPVRLTVHCRAVQDLLRPIVGFWCKDRLGQNLFGDNTYLAFKEHPPRIPAGARFQGSFFFTMPILQAGEYTFSASVAEGTQLEHVQHQWLHDALVIRSVTTSVCTGLVGIPMKNITLSLLEDG